MDNSPLNQAHREQRRAESFQRGGRLEEAAECHGRAAELLKAALSLTKNNLALQSITLQYDHHLRQHQLLRFRNKQLEKYVKAMENQRVKIGSVSGSSGSGSGSGSGLGSGSGSRELPSSLVSNFGKKAHTISMEMAKYSEKFDSILYQLTVEENEIKSQQGLSNFSRESQEMAAPFEKLATSAAVGGAKELAAVVEELRSLHDHQTDLVTQLLSELSSAEKENSLLKAQVRELQARCEGYESERRRLRAMADSSCSPFVFSPLSEFSPDPPDVPDLAPLEMPPLDFLDNHEADS
ncbi:nuclear receptor-binding factor 2-like isoform X2 [Portunus trituberculatus]|uniref:nuclear receptor-binding factor 2-like isoform X2 n=1 Tax=Portunus trituberculatus TaxID=210409 RepID=UPI001E1CC778|nr:nuclear receptor-binding factor 2-like isoform X2 [Portunus trituberculatus]